MKVLFLDIDGPLAWGTRDEGPIKIIGGVSIPYPWLQEQCDAITRIINATNAKIVISSDWKRYYTQLEFEEIFKFYGIPTVLLGTTSLRHAKMSSSAAMDRAYQIAEWVTSVNGSLESWIAIDDYNIAPWFERMTGDHPFITKDNAIQTIGDHSNVMTLLTDVESKIIEHLNGGKRN